MFADGLDDISGEMSKLAVDPDALQGLVTGSSSSSSSYSSIRSQDSSYTATHHALMPSLFSHVPPTINFVLDGQKCRLFFVAVVITIIGLLDISQPRL